MTSKEIEQRIIEEVCKYTATLGCLLALVRQAYGRMMYVRWWDNPQPDMSGQSRARCEVVDTLGRNRLAGARTFYPSEAEALVAALEAA